MYSGLIASFILAAVMLAATDGFARSGSAPRGAFASTHSNPSVTHSLRHNRRNRIAPLWPAAGGFYYGPSNGEAVLDVTQAPSADIHQTYTYDVPWDWAHRYPPTVAPGERPYVQSCTAETVAFPAHDGSERTVNVIRCY
jgi:hypothetical protein